MEEIIRSLKKNLEDRIKPLEKGKEESAYWRAEHDGRINAWWDSQKLWNERIEDKLKSQKTSLDSLKLSLWKMVVIVIVTSLGTDMLWKNIGAMLKAM